MPVLGGGGAAGGEITQSPGRQNTGEPKYRVSSKPAQNEFQDGSKHDRFIRPEYTTARRGLGWDFRAGRGGRKT